MECETFYNMGERKLHKVFQKNLESCETSEARVVKTIRMRFNDLVPWIRYSDIKVGRLSLIRLQMIMIVPS